MQSYRLGARKALRLLGVGAAGAFACTAPAQAHEKWFLDNTRFPLRWDLFFTPKPLMFVGFAIVLTAVAGWFQYRRGRELIPPIAHFGATARAKERIFAFMPAIVGIHVAIAMIVVAMNDRLFTPNARLFGASAYVGGLVELLVALAFLYGGLTRLAAVVLALLWAFGLFAVGVQSMLDDILYLGIAAFFFMCGRGPVSIDRYVFPRLEPGPQLARYAIAPLRIGLGLTFIIVAFTEKFANLPYGLAFLQRYHVNFTPALHMPLANDTFLLCAATVELILGLWLVLGIFQREIIIVAWIPINISLTYFGAAELIGHLPIYGIIALLLIWDRRPDTVKAWVAGVTSSDARGRRS